MTGAADGVTTASAPGKLVLLGEYAVLEGAPALVVAMPQRARVALAPRSGGPSRLRARPLQERALAFGWADGALRWETGDAAILERLAWAARLIEGLAQRGWWPATPVDVDLDTCAFHGDDGAKLGLGSSAALAVALAHAGARAAGVDEAELTLDRLVALHRGLQGETGSGVDIAAARLGGLVHYRLVDGVPEAVPVGLSPQVGLLAVVTGTAFSTGAALERLRSWRRTHAVQWERLYAALADAAERGSRAAARDGAALVAAVAEFAHGLDALERATGLEIFGEAHTLPRRLAAQAGVAYKPSGAGGDLGIAASDDPDRLADLRTRAVAAGLGCWPIEAGVSGVACETTAAAYD